MYDLDKDYTIQLDNSWICITVKYANDGLLQANANKMLGNDGKILANDGEMSVWSYSHFTIIAEDFTTINEYFTSITLKVIIMTIIKKLNRLQGG